MTKPCINNCTSPLRFPKRPDDPPNRPGLAHIDYRIGTYADFREAMIRQLNTSPTLLAWTHREPDDPGIALLEGAAILGDILTFYQELYANEAFLGTAQWRGSVSDLVRLLGYRLSPGLGGRATFAFEVKGTKSVMVPKGFLVKAKVEGIEEEAEFETIDNLVAYPWLSRFNLFRPLQQPHVGKETTEFYIASPDQDLSPILLEAEDKILIGDPAPGSAPNRLTNAEIVIIDSVREAHGTTIYKIKGSLRRTDTVGSIAGFKLGRSFHHFGYDGPQTFIDPGGPVTTTDTATGSETTVDQLVVSFQRSLSGTTQSSTSSFATSFASTATAFLPFSSAFAFPFPTSPITKAPVTIVAPPIAANQVPLDIEVQDLPNSAVFLMQIGTTAVVRKIISTTNSAMKWGQLTGTTSVVNLDSALATPEHSSADIRELVFYEVLSPLITLKAALTDSDEDTGSELSFFGTDAEAQTLTNRRLTIADVEPKQVAVQSVDAVSPLDRPRLRKIKLDTVLNYALFPHQEPFLDVFGNLIDATQGKTESESVLGSGDNTQIFQTFKVPSAPLTYLLSVGDSPPEVPELQIYVNNKLWKHVPTLFGHRFDEQIYIVREDENNDSYVQFGDGKTGARLPTGFENVTAVYRKGTGAYGALVEGTQVQGGKLEGLDKIQMPDVSSGGSQPEDGDNAKEAAPAKVQSLDRLVGLQDFESEVAAISGVARARAAWQLRNNIPAVVVTVLMQTGRAEEADAVTEVIRHYNRCRGPNRHPVIVEPGTLQYVRISVDFGFDPAFKEDLIRIEIANTLGTNSGKSSEGDNLRGLFGLKYRSFEQPEYANSIVAAVQNVAGVKWAIVRVFSALPASDDPATIVLDSTTETFNDVVAPGPTQILSLFSAHLTLTAIAETVKGVC